MKLILALVLLASLSAFAQDDDDGPPSCRKVDMSNEFPSAHDQGNTLYCYAFVAADLLGHALGVKPPNSVSTLHVLSRFITLRKEGFVSAQKKIIFENVSPMGYGNDLEGNVPHNPDYKTGVPMVARGSGTTDVTLSAVIGSGKVCLENEVPSEGLRREGVSPTKQLTAKIPEVPNQPLVLTMEKSSTRSQIEFPKSFLNDRILQLSGDLNGYRPSAESLGAVLPFGIGKLSISDLYECRLKPSQLKLIDLQKAGSAVNDWAAAKLTGEIEKACKKPVSIDDLEVHTATFHSNKEDKAASLRLMNKLLGKRKPFGIALVLEDLTTEGGLHEVMAVGRKWNHDSNKCELQIRNSFGTVCPPKLATGVRCDEKGTLWMPIEQMAGMNTELTYLQKGD